MTSFSWLAPIGAVKKYAYIVLSGLLATSAFLLRIFYLKSKSAEKKAESYKAQVDRAIEIAEDDVQTEMDHQSRSAEIAKDVEESKHTDELSNPNDW